MQKVRLTTRIYLKGRLLDKGAVINYQYGKDKSLLDGWAVPVQEEKPKPAPKGKKGDKGGAEPETPLA